jgi:hypothetical protein
MGMLSAFDRLRFFGRRSIDEAARLDVGSRVEGNQWVPGGITDSYSLHGIPTRDCSDNMLMRMGDISPLLPTRLPRGRKINRGKVTTLENTPASPAKNAKLRGNGTL